MDMLYWKCRQKERKKMDSPEFTREELLSRYKDNIRNFRHFNLRGVDLTDTHFQRADFTKSDLRGVNFTNADLSEANFTGADLTGADLTGADLCFANLSEANLTDVKGVEFPYRSPNLLSTVASTVLADPQKLEMSNWHNSCGTAHCIAGWAVVLADCRHLETDILDAFALASYLLGSEATSHFYNTKSEALEWIQNLE
jgi:hypothetical protein